MPAGCVRSERTGSEGSSPRGTRGRWGNAAGVAWRQKAACPGCLGRAPGDDLDGVAAAASDDGDKQGLAEGSSWATGATREWSGKVQRLDSLVTDVLTGSWSSARAGSSSAPRMATCGTSSTTSSSPRVPGH
jgi:hypothetical protein